LSFNYQITNLPNYQIPSGPLLFIPVHDASQRGIRWALVPAYIAAQSAGAIIGVFAAHAMFGEKILQTSLHVRSGMPLLLSEFIATFGLLATIWGCSRFRIDAIPFAVGAYITSAYWFTASTSFANPAVTLARGFTNTFAGIRPQDAPAFILVQLAGAFAATLLFRWLIPRLPEKAPEILVAHDRGQMR